MNLTETKGKEKKYRSNTGQGGKQQGYHRKPRQDNYNKMITFKQISSNHENNELEEIGNTLAEVLTSTNRRTSSTETIIVSETIE